MKKIQTQKLRSMRLSRFVRNPMSANASAILLSFISLAVVSVEVMAAENTNRGTAEAVCGRSDVIFCENWEDGDSTGWADFQPISSSGSHWGGIGCAAGCDFPYTGYNSSRSLVLRLPPNDPDSMYPAASFNDAVGANDTLYLRYYVYWSPGFEFNVHGNKNSYLRSASASWRAHVQLRPNRDGSSANINEAIPYIHFYCGQIDVTPGSPEATACYDSGGDLRYWPNQSGRENFHVMTGQWYSIEMMVKPNPSGNSFGGHVSLWVDGVLMVDYDNVSVRHAASTEPMENVWLTTYFGGGGQSTHPDQYVLYDNIVVSRGYIGPSGGGDTLAPAAPSNLTVR